MTKRELPNGVVIFTAQTLTVKELIEKLQQCGQDKEVVLQGTWDGEFNTLEFDAGGVQEYRTCVMIEDCGITSNREKAAYVGR
jgi:hypothetical protein